MAGLAEARFDRDPLSVEAMSDPLSFYKELRDHHPVYYFDDYDTFFFSRFEDVWEVLRVGENAFVATETNLPTPEYLRSHRNKGAPPFASTNPMSPGPSLPSPWYEEMRSAHIAPLRPKSVAALADFIRMVVRTRLDELIGRGKFDLITDLAGYVASSAICHLFGLPPEKAESLLHDVNAITRPPENESVDFAVFFVRLKEHIVPAIQARRAAGADGGNSLIDGLVNYRTPEGRALGDDEIADQLVCIMIGGMESAPKVFGQGILQLWQHPDQLAQVRADLGANVAVVVEEMVRFGAPAQYTFRTAHKDVTVAGQQVKAGQRVACMLHSASRDEREFPNPEEFVWNRPIPRVISFGLGQHHCIGKHLALLEVRTLVHEFLSRANSFEFVMAEAVRNPSYFQRGWISLPVIVTQAI